MPVTDHEGVFAMYFDVGGYDSERLSTTPVYVRSVFGAGRNLTEANFSDTPAV